MKKKTLKIGTSDFRTIISDNGYFVDKTMLIKDFWENSNYILLMTRPRRFGKSLNLSMIEHFFDIQKPESKNLFTEFEISKHHEFCEEHQNKYPVINISLKDIKAENWKECYDKFKTEIFDLYNKHRYLLDSDKITELEKENFQFILEGNALKVKFEYSLKYLSEYLKKHFANDVIILVDEYDTPIINAFKNTRSPVKTGRGQKTYYENSIDFMQIFLGKAFKGNENLKKGFLTGVMRIGRESIFSEWNNFSVFGIVSPYFADSFGFTQKETEDILTYFNLSDRVKEIKKWYNGYTFGHIKNVYNPWSIVNYISREREGLKPYWINSGDYSLIKERITEPGAKEKIKELIEGNSIHKPIKENFIFPDFEQDIELIWTLLVYNGYLTQIKESKYGNYELKIPNEEIKIVFKDIISGWLNTDLKVKRDLLISTTEYLVQNQPELFEKGLKMIIGDTLSYFDLSGKSTEEEQIIPEQIFHVYTLGLLTVLTDDYIVKSNRESFGGRYDIMLIPHDKSENGVVIEIKQTEKKQLNEDKNQFRIRINRELKNALHQIESHKYYQELIANKVPENNIIKVPIVFAGKEPFVTEIKE
jgi:hypothetical protein